VARVERRLYTPDEEDKVVSMKKGGADFKEIGKELGRDPEALRAKWYALRAKGKTKKSKLKKEKIIRRPYKSAEAIITPQAVRPMIALVGTPQEVTATIRELFS
jgi:hypothetical protein